MIGQRKNNFVLVLKGQRIKRKEKEKKCNHPAFRTLYLLCKAHWSSNKCLAEVFQGYSAAWEKSFGWKNKPLCAHFPQQYYIHIWIILTVGFFLSPPNNPCIVTKLLQSCQAAVTLTRIQAISSNSNYDRSAIRMRINIELFNMTVFFSARKRLMSRWDIHHFEMVTHLKH